MLRGARSHCDSLRDPGASRRDCEVALRGSICELAGHFYTLVCLILTITLCGAALRFPPKDVLKYSPLLSVNVTLFGNKAFAVAIKM